MNKELQRYYDLLDLPIKSTIEDVEMRRNALIKIYNNKSQDKGVSYDKQIGEIEVGASKIIANIKNNGIPKEENHYFDSSWKSILILGVVLLSVGMLCAFSFYIFL